jgi:hypothetical protein
MTRIVDEKHQKKRLLRDLSRRFLLQFHTAILIAWTFCVGLLTTKLLWWLELDAMWLRYTLAILVAYAAFLLGVRVWLAYIGLGRHVRRRDPDDVPRVDLPSSGGGSKGGGAFESPGGGGGQYGGGGATDRYGSGEIGLPEPLGEITAEASGNLAENAFEGLGEAAGAAGEGCLPVLAAGAVLSILAGVFSLGAYVVSEAPLVLVEAAFEAMLAGGLLRSRRWASEADWLGAVLGYTWKTLVFVLAVAWAFALAAAHFLPEARTLAQVFATLLGA